MEIKGSGVVWKYQDVADDYGKKLALELAGHLNHVLSYYSEIEVMGGKYYIEVRPLGVNKGMFAHLLLKYG